jgi:outer membrane protein TolC
VKIQYEGGSANVTRYLEAELDRNRASLRQATALYDREKALAEAARATGFWAVYSRKGTENGNPRRQDR